MGSSNSSRLSFGPLAAAEGAGSGPHAVPLLHEGLRFSPYLAAALVTEIVLPQTDPQVDSVSALQLMQAPQMQMP